MGGANTLLVRRRRGSVTVAERLPVDRWTTARPPDQKKQQQKNYSQTTVNLMNYSQTTVILLDYSGSDGQQTYHLTTVGLLNYSKTTGLAGVEPDL